LRFGRSLDFQTEPRSVPDYIRTDQDTDRIVLRGGESSLEFAALVFEQDRNGKSLTLDELLILNALQVERRITAHEAGHLIQNGVNVAKATLELLIERGLVQGIVRRAVDFTCYRHRCTNA
jgi:ATP-dependent DNA helicase RecG